MSSAPPYNSLRCVKAVKGVDSRKLGAKNSSPSKDFQNHKPPASLTRLLCVKQMLECKVCDHENLSKTNSLSLVTRLKVPTRRHCDSSANTQSSCTERMQKNGFERIFMFFSFFVLRLGGWCDNDFTENLEICRAKS